MSPRGHARALAVAWPTGSIFIARCPQSSVQKEKKREKAQFGRKKNEEGKSRGRVIDMDGEEGRGTRIKMS